MSENTGFRSLQHDECGDVVALKSSTERTVSCLTTSDSQVAVAAVAARALAWHFNRQFQHTPNKLAPCDEAHVGNALQSCTLERAVILVSPNSARLLS